MKLKISNRDKKLLMYLAAILIPVLIFVFVFTKVSDAANVLKTENDTLSLKVSELERLTDQKDYYEEEIETMKTRKAEIIKEFPAEVLAEDQIVFARDLSSRSGMVINQVGFGEQEMFSEIYDEATFMTALRVPTGLSFQVSYDGLKTALQYIINNTNCVTIHDISLAYDNSTGNLTGTMNLNMYAIAGTDKTYTGPSIPGVPTGTPNIFQTIQ